MYLEGVVHPEFWYGGSDPKRKADFRAAWDYFTEVREEGFPEIGEWLETLARAEKSHAGRFGKGLAELG